MHIKIDSNFSFFHSLKVLLKNKKSKRILELKVQNLKFHFSSTDPIPPIPQDSEENYKNMASIVIGKLHFKKM